MIFWYVSKPSVRMPTIVKRKLRFCERCASKSFGSVMKNCELLVSLPLLAMARMPGLSKVKSGLNSSLKAGSDELSEVEVPPPWIMKLLMTRGKFLPMKKPEFTRSRMRWAASGAESVNSRTVREPVKGTPLASVPLTVKRTLWPPDTTEAATFGLSDATVVLTAPSGVLVTLTGMKIGLSFGMVGWLIVPSDTEGTSRASKDSSRSSRVALFLSFGEMGERRSRRSTVKPPEYGETSVQELYPAKPHNGDDAGRGKDGNRPENAAIRAKPHNR